MPTAAIRKALRKSSLFGDLSDEERDKIAQFSREMTFETGDILFREGDSADNIFIVLKGTAAVEVGLLGRQRRRCATIATACRGESVGWSAGIGSQKYLASAYAVEKTATVVVDRRAVHSLFADNPASGLRVMEKLVDLARSRLSRTTEILAKMLSTASHDLKGPLAAIQSLHQVILGGYAGEISEQQEKLLTRAGERIKGLVSQIDDIFDITHIDSHDMQREAVSIAEIANKSLENVRPQAAGKNIDLVADWDMEPPVVPGEHTRLQQALINLLGNAIKFTQSGGKVTVRITDDNEGQKIVVEVMDNGPGIPGEELHRIFDDFYRGNDAPIGGGAGVGLSNAKRIIEAHGGRIWAESPYPESKKGAKFTFTLPKGTAKPDTGKKEEMSSHESRN
ncbi:MAG: ATP-binding protein [Syntrophobacteraceae bacterium]